MTLIKLCAYLTSFFILVWFLKFILTLFQVVLIKLHKEDVPKDMLRWLNPFMLPAIIMEKERKQGREGESKDWRKDKRKGEGEDSTKDSIK